MADILIRGMEIPKERSLWLCIKTDGTVYNIKPGGIGTAHAVGTVLPLPEGHGRLIDAEAYVDYMQNRYDNNEITNGDWIDFRLSLKDQPTIVPAEGGMEKCSEN